MRDVTVRNTTTLKPSTRQKTTSKATTWDMHMLQMYLHKAEVELRDNILPFWMNYTVDIERGGFYGHVSNSLEVDAQAPKGALLSSRILWTYSAAYLQHRNKEYLDMARLAYDDLMARFWDETYSGLYWMTDAGGTPTITRKHIFGQAFGIYALSEYFLASGDPEALQRAIALFRAIEDHSYDHEHQGYFEAYTREWQLESDLRLSATDMNEKKSLNTHLHILEAYTNLLRVWENTELREKLIELIHVMLERIIDPVSYHTRAFFDEAWNVRSSLVSFGHDIETSWLLAEAANVIGDRKLSDAVKATAVGMAQATYAEGMDGDGGIFYAIDAEGVLNANKEWWPQAEAVVGFLNAYQMSGQPAFLEAALHTWDFIDQHLIDYANGEWFKSVSRAGVVQEGEAKVSLWKCPYHNGRTCLEMSRRLQELIRAEVPFEAERVLRRSRAKSGSAAA